MIRNTGNIYIYKAAWKKLGFVLASDWSSEVGHRFVSGLTLIALEFCSIRRISTVEASGHRFQNQSI